MPRPMHAICVFLVVSIAFTANAADRSEQSLERRFADIVQPFMKKHCFACHGDQKQEGKLKLSDDSSVAAVVKNHRVWDIVVERLEAEEMPPPKAPQPTINERKAVIEWIKSLREHEARRNAGDPGIVLARRLSNAEFDYTIRDLTGIDIRPTREFPVDPANEAGFDNSGESLTMSPALVKKYLSAARLVADHLVLKPKGFDFAPHPAVTETDRDKFCVQRIVDFYRRHQVDYADYFLAAWRFQNRERLGQGSASLSDFAGEAKLSTKYLTAIWSALTEPEESGPLAEIQAEWRKLPEIKPGEPEAVRPRTAKDQKDVRGLTPAGSPNAPDEVRRGCEQMRDLVIKLRKELDSKIEKLHVKGQSDGSQPLVLWWNRQVAAQRMRSVGDGKDETLDAARARFCRVFPNAFSVSSRGHYADPNLGVQLRLLTAGFHLMQGYFRDDEPLCELVLNDAEKQELDTLWQELNFVTLVPQRQYKDFLFFERAEPPRFAGGAEFDFARPEDKDVTSEAKLKRMRDAYLVKARQQEASDQAIEAIETYFANMNADIRWIERTRREAEPSHLAALAKFAERAYRRPLSSAERDELLAFYRSLREQDGLNHEDAIRDSVVSVLMSPHFCFRFGSVSLTHGRGADDARTAQPLSDYELASRLSYFLWSSLPDDELLAHAAAGDLHQPETLVAQTRRMLRDDRIRGLATEFAGNWLEFRRFEEHNSVDRERFASFTNELRQAMYEEPIRFFVDLAKNNRSVLDLVDAGHTFVNPILAKHYGIDVGQASQPDRRPGKADLQEEWLRIDDARRYGRGGLLPMAVFLTKNSPGLRTSPVKRGYWVVRRLLGEHIPAPPPEVPELPKDEAQLGELTLPQLLARHRDNKACAGCHQRFDSIGLVFEGYGPIGERRDKDLGGRAVDARATFPDGSDGAGLDGLRRYLSEKRHDDFVDNVCRKLLAYALGRSLLLSDKTTIEQMRAKLRSDDHRFGSLVESIVTSPQFLKKRGPDDSRE